MSAQLPLPGPQRDECPCKCGAYGVLRRRAWSDGLHHTRNCECKRYCEASRFPRRAKRREQGIAKDLGGTREPFSGALSGADVTAPGWSFEETSNEAVIRGFRRWWTSKTVTRKVARLFARHGEAHALILSWGGKPRVVICEYPDFIGQFGAQMVEMCGGSGFDPKRSFGVNGTCTVCEGTFLLLQSEDGGPGGVIPPHQQGGAL